MTIWLPSLDDSSRPKYFAIADAIAGAMDTGRLRAGSRLPTHRDLADRLGVTVGTVSRGYAEARRRGLVVGEVGRGTFVRGSLPDEVSFGLRDVDDPGTVDLSMNLPVLGACDADLASAIGELSRVDDVGQLLDYQPHAGAPRHRDAGAIWIRRTSGHAFDPDQIIVTCGAQHAMLLALSVLARPGDAVLAESLAYPGMIALARMLGLRLAPVALDHDGLVPEALEEACRRFAPRALYCTPSVQNPTGTVMSQERRQEVARICERNGVAVVEDDTYGFLAPDAAPPISALLPDAGFYITTLSKSVAPGVRVGFLRAPVERLAELGTAMMATTWMVSPITSELATRWIEEGAADRAVRWRRREATERRRMAERVLEPYAADLRGVPAFHLWFPLPEPWRAEAFVAQARAGGVVVSSPETFAVGRGATPHAVRLCLGSPRDRQTLREALTVLSNLLTRGPAPNTASL